MIDKEKLFNDNINIAYKIANQYRLNYFNEFEDIKQIALLGLWKAINTYNGKHAISTYSYKVIYNEINQYLRHLKKQDKTKEISLYTNISYNNELEKITIEDLLEDNNCIEDIDNYLELNELRIYEKQLLLHESEKNIRIWNYLKSGYTQQYIEKLENISQAQVSRIRKNLLNKLKNLYEGDSNR